MEDMQLWRSLEQLQESVDVVFGRIAERVSRQHSLLDALSRRIQSAKAKVEAISGTRKAITVFSSSKYPQIVSDEVDFTPLFGASDGLPAVEIDLSRGNWKDDGTLELFRFFLETSQEDSFPPSTGPKDGVGSVPGDLRSISDLLLFNSTAAPYHEYRIIDNLQTVDQPEKSETQPVKLPSPPQSLLRNNNVSTPGIEEYGFKPMLRQVPLFSLPSRLPDLPMVADINWTDTRSNLEDLSSIAPSAAYRSPQKVAADKTVKLQVSSPGLVQQSPPVSLLPPTNEPLLTAKLQTPPKPPPLNSLIPSTPEKKSSPPPPPPSSPPPPPPASSPVSEQRAALLESIRSPNIRLRKTGLMDTMKDQQPGNQAQQQKQTVDKSPDEQRPSSQALQQKQPIQPPEVLAEMAAVLKMRRLSMKGASHDVSGLPSSQESEPTTAAESKSIRVLPIKNFQAFISEEPRDVTEEDEDWEE